MDINTILGSSEKDVAAIRMTLINVKATLQVAAYDYARAALGAADETLKSVHAAHPCGAVWPHIVEYNQFVKKATDTLQATSQATGLLLVAEETGTDSIDKMNADAKVDSIDVSVISSLLEGAMIRMELALRGVPENGAPGQRCNPSKLRPPKTKKPPRPKA